MDTREWTTIDKLGWGRGPWTDECDKKQWPDAATGLPCLAVRHGSSGHWCGYVGVASEHPAFARRYDDVDVEVHGGLTFADTCAPNPDEASDICHVPGPGEPDHVWWLGFDCHHGGDASPVYRRLFDDGRPAVYRTLQYVEGECARLAGQLARLAAVDSSAEALPEHRHA